MPRKPSRAEETSELRRLAESRIRDSGKEPAATASGPTEVHAARLLQELEVHQVELSMQNAELRETRDELESALARYTDLYDFAPAGYFSLDEEGVILRANLTGASKLGTARDLLIGRKLERFVVRENVPTFRQFLERAFERAEEQICEVQVRSAAKRVFWADVHATAGAPKRDEARRCRVVLSDISALKRADEAQARVEEISGRYRELGLEIARRQEVETSLRRSERHYARLLAESNRMQEQLRMLSRGIFHAQEEERRRISRELHDEVAQCAVGMKVHLEILGREVAGKSKSRQARIATTHKLLTELLDAVHRCSRDLRPAVLDDLGLVPALKSFTRDFAKHTGIEVGFTPSPAAERLSGDKRTVLYRVAQEALNNVAKHARATRADVVLESDGHVVRMEISDDGRAFKVERALAPGKRRRLGLLGMRERVEMVGGTFSVDSAPGKGTVVRASIPVADGAPAGAPQSGPA